MAEEKIEYHTSLVPRGDAHDSSVLLSLPPLSPLLSLPPPLLLSLPPLLQLSLPPLLQLDRQATSQRPVVNYAHYLTHPEIVGSFSKYFNCFADCLLSFALHGSCFQVKMFRGSEIRR